MSKAFDSVDHDILIKKIEMYGIRGVALKLITSYLHNRKQCVIESDESGELIKSDTIQIQKGVPQGSILGPILYILYTNDLASVTNISSIMYADDTSLIVSENTEDILKETVLGTLDSVGQYFHSLNLMLNKEKTQVINFNYRKNNNKIILTDGINTLISRTDTSFLGVNIDSRLDWRPHIDYLAKNMARYCYALKVIARNINISTAFMAYHAYIQSKIKYGIIFWGNSCDVERIFRLQKRCLRNILNMRQTESCKQIFIKNKILTLTSLYIYEAIKFVTENASLFEEYDRNHLYNTRNKNDLTTDKPNYTYIQKNVPFSIIKIYNKMPVNI